MSTESSNPADDDRTQIIAPPKAPPPAPATTTAGHSSAGDSGNALPIGTYLSEFEVNSVLGEGGFGIVYLAWDHSLERRVALKEYMPSSLASRTLSNGVATQVQVKSERHRGTFEAGMKSFINEAKLLASFDHPSLVKVYRFWEANGTAYMVMPFYEGTTLKDRLKALGKAPDEAWLMGLLAPLTEALAVIHQERCYHRDIAPDNVILLNAGGRPLLLDFGAARRVIGDMTQALTVILKPGYAPVEQYAETPNMKQGGWTDVYALAATIHFAILGRTPPPSVSRLMGDNYQPLVESAAGRYSERFLSAIDKALRVRPEERTQTIGELRADLGLDAEMPHHAQKTQIVLRGDATGMSGDEKTRLEVRPPAPARAPSPAPALRPRQQQQDDEAAATAAPAPSSKMPLMLGLGALV
ncbi:serine/threonine-protein kinase, partial [Pelomonas sp. KK5]|uniref:serine/threonine protein kinase n=1 Tax=Pelomonas sp. KK5 TaxID=1855730 RepID=UPI00117D8B61